MYNGIKTIGTSAVKIVVALSLLKAIGRHGGAKG